MIDQGVPICSTPIVCDDMRAAAADAFKYDGWSIFVL
jgi:hypothetical protein